MDAAAAQPGPARPPARSRALAVLTGWAIAGHVLLLQGLRDGPASAVGSPSSRGIAASPSLRPVSAGGGPSRGGAASRVVRAELLAPPAVRPAAPAPAGGVPDLAARAAALAPQVAAVPPQAAAAQGGAAQGAAQGATREGAQGVVQGAVQGVPQAAPAAAGDPLPEYPVALPQDFQVPLAVQRDGRAGEGQLLFTREPGGGYRVHLSLRVSGRPLLEMSSSGQVGESGLGPERFTDRRERRGASAANFDAPSGTVRFSTGAAQAEVARHAQDRLSWLVQLGAVVAADARLQQPGAQVLLQVVGARGSVQLWRFDATSPGGPPRAGPPVDGLLRFVREPEQPHDLRVEAWLDPARHHRPVRVRLTPVPAGAGLEFWHAEGGGSGDDGAGAGGPGP